VLPGAANSQSDELVASLLEQKDAEAALEGICAEAIQVLSLG
jgi:hypothetical protein